MRLLLVEDDHILGSSLTKALEKHAYGVDWLQDGESALAALSDCDFAAAILDINLPKMNGLEAARTIRQLAPSTEILFLSFHDSMTVVQEALNAGGRGYLCKSDAGTDLVSAVEAVSQHQPFLSASVQGAETLSAATASPVAEQESLPGAPIQANRPLSPGTAVPATEKESGIDAEKEPKKNPGALKAA